MIRSLGATPRRSSRIVRRRRRRLEQAKTAQRSDSEQVIRIVGAINAEMGFDALLRAIVGELEIVGGAERIIFLVRDRNTQRFRVRASFGVDTTGLQDLELIHDEVRTAYLDDSVEVHPDLFLARQSVVDSGDGDQPGSTLAFAIRVKGEIDGLLVLENPTRADAFEDRDTMLVHRLAEHIAPAFAKVRMVQDLRDLIDKRTEFLRVAAHDFRSPLTSIMAFLQVTGMRIRRGTFDTGDTLRRIDQLLALAKETIQLLERLLDLSMIESGAGEPGWSRVDMANVLARCEARHRHAAELKRIELRLDADGLLPEVLGDPIRLGQVVDNLLNNALKYTHPGGTVRLRCRTEQRDVITSVRDTGQGLSDKDLRQVFRSFRRLSAIPTAGESSTGLGLAIAKGIVEAHGGRIWVESEQGMGAAFFFSLPAAPAAAE